MGSPGHSRGSGSSQDPSESAHNSTVRFCDSPASSSSPCPGRSVMSCRAAFGSALGTLSAMSSPAQHSTAHCCSLPSPAPGQGRAQPLPQHQLRKPKRNEAKPDSTKGMNELEKQRAVGWSRSLTAQCEPASGAGQGGSSPCCCQLCPHAGQHQATVMERVSQGSQPRSGIWTPGGPPAATLQLRPAQQCTATLTAQQWLWQRRGGPGADPDP